MRRSKPLKCSAPEIVAALRGNFSEPAHVVLEQVRNATGYGRTERYADALVCSVWPSRGLWFAGVEVKVSRSDWQNELKDPAKSAEIQRFCQYWWLAAPAGLVRDGELPAAWGLLEYNGKKLTCTQAAPELKAEPPTAELVCSVLRNASRVQNELPKEAERRGKAKAETACDPAHVRELEYRIKELEAEKEVAEHLAKCGREAINQLREIGGLLDMHGWYGGDKIARASKRLDALRQFEQCELPARAQQLRDAADALDAAGANITNESRGK